MCFGCPAVSGRSSDLGTRVRHAPRGPAAGLALHPCCALLGQRARRHLAEAPHMRCACWYLVLSSPPAGLLVCSRSWPLPLLPLPVGRALAPYRHPGTSFTWRCPCPSLLSRSLPGARAAGARAPYSPPAPALRWLDAVDPRDRWAGQGERHDASGSATCHVSRRAHAPQPEVTWLGFLSTAA